ncbi:MAG: ABC transporter substrate-binding protein [Clostridia bacterium]|nr:ABC transporter substrate-binding protein [Clostridia bacterium]
MKKKLSTLMAVLLVICFMFTLNVSASQELNAEKSGQKCLGKCHGETKYPITVKDAWGTEVTLSKKPQNIVSVTLATDEILLSLVDKSRIKALTYLSVDPGLSNVVEAAKEIPIKVVGKAEIITALESDLVFVADWHSKEFVQKLRDAKLNVYVTKTANNIIGVQENLRKIAYIVGEYYKGQKVICWMNSKLAKIQHKVKKIPMDKRLTVLDYDPFESTSGKGTSFEDVVTRAGLINLPSKEGMEGWPSISREQIAKLNPDVIILPSISYDPNIDPQAFAEGVRKDPILADVGAVKNNRVIILPESHMSSVSQYMVLGIEDTAKAIYPQLFK